MNEERAALELIKKAAIEKHESLGLVCMGLTSLPREIGKCSNLKELDLTDNMLSSLPAEIGQLRDLRRLDLAGNHYLTSLPGEIGQLTELRKLHLSVTALRSLPREIGQLTKLQELHASETNLRSLPREIGQLTELRCLDLCMTGLSTLPNEIAHLTNLEDFDISTTAISIPNEVKSKTPKEMIDYYLQHKLPAVVEVYVTEVLNQQEIGCFYFHLQELHQSDVAKDVHLAGHRHESDGSVLRFQGSDFDAIYRVLPDLLAPFRHSRAVKWEELIEALATEQRADSIAPHGVWRIAERLIEMFESYRNAKVIQINEGKSRALSIDLFTDDKIADRLAAARLPELWDGRQFLPFYVGEYAPVQIGEMQVGDKYEAGQVGAMGPRAHAHDITFQQIWNQAANDVDLSKLVTELSQLREAMRQSPGDHDIPIGQVAEAEAAASKGDGPTALKHLKKAGSWTFDVATKIGVSTAAAALKHSLGL